VTFPLAELTRTFARVAALSFGGPAGQIAVMHRILVDEKRWLDEARFLHALNFCMLLPGPEAQQLATYSGWLLRGVPGALIAGGLFILPGVAAIMALSVVYALWGSVGIVAGLFFGLKAAVLAIVVQAVVRVGRRAATTPAARAISAAAFIAIFAFGAPFPAIVLAAMLVGWAGTRAGLKSFRNAPAGHGPAPLGGKTDVSHIPVEHPSATSARNAGLAALVLWLISVAVLSLLLPGSVWAGIATFFSKLAVLSFGGAYAVLAWVAQEAVTDRGWLTAGEMLDGLGMAETTPGPLIMVLQFVGFMAALRVEGTLPAAALGGLLATWVTFAPCFAFILLGAPWIERLRGNAALSGALAAVTAAVVGVILNLAVWFALHTIFRQVLPGPPPLPVWSSLDPAALALATAAMVMTFPLRWGMSATLTACAGAGIALHMAGIAG